MRALYNLLLYLATPLALARLYWRSLRLPDYRRRWGERLGRIAPIDGRPIWIHAVSVGETQAAEPLVKRLRADYPEVPILITTTTPTGAERVRALFGDSVQHRYFPYDLPGVVARYLRQVQPRLLLMMETEIWPNLLRRCRQQDIPTLLANARLSGRSARGYARLGRLARDTFADIGCIAAQGEVDARRFVELGADAARVQVTGSIKFDQQIPASVREQAEALRRVWGVDRPVWVAASTHAGEEEQVLDAHAWLLESMPNALLVLVPRHPDRFEQVATLVEQRGLSMVRRSAGLHCLPQTCVYLGDSMGELVLFFEAADVAFVGGSLARVGGHNVLEPAALGRPVLFGPHMFNFGAISELLLEQGAARQVGSSEELAVQLRDWLGDASERGRVGEQGRLAVEANRGALERLLGLLKAQLALN